MNQFRVEVSCTPELDMNTVGKSKAPPKINEAFTPIAIDYGKEVLDNYVLL